MKNTWLITLVGGKKIEAENVRLEEGFVALYRETKKERTIVKKIKKLIGSQTKQVVERYAERIFTHIIPPQSIKIIELKEGE